jgi:hypothetical protein
MPWYVYLAAFVSGAFAANGIPHIAQGMCGNRFQTPFARPLGVGESSALVNVVWGWLNWLVAAALIHWVWPSEFPAPLELCALAAVGALAMGLYVANHFGKVRSVAPHP